MQLKSDIAEAKRRQDEASKDVKKIERDMRDFDNNKDSKLAELQVRLSRPVAWSTCLMCGQESVDSLKKRLGENSTSVKAVQKELQETKLEFGESRIARGSASSR